MSVCDRCDSRDNYGLDLRGGEETSIAWLLSESSCLSFQYGNVRFNNNMRQAVSQSTHTQATHRRHTTRYGLVAVAAAACNPGGNPGGRRVASQRPPLKTRKIRSGKCHGPLVVDGRRLCRCRALGLAWLAWLARGRSNEGGGGGDGLSMAAGMGISLYHGSGTTRVRPVTGWDRAGCNRSRRFSCSNLMIRRAVDAPLTGQGGHYVKCIPERAGSRLPRFAQRLKARFDLATRDPSASPVRRWRG
jgi:hypothetical protein